MNFSKKQTAIIISMPLVMLLAIFIAAKITIKAPLKPDEQKLINVSDIGLSKIAERKSPIVIKSAVNPIQRGAIPGEKNYPDVPLASVSPPLASAPQPVKEMASGVSFILVNPERKMAVVDGKMVYEGDMVGQKRVVRIDKSKVLLQDRKGKVWLSLK